jgi:glycine C-acetyltransferase/8-amino-7-oxononanoate synthase
MQRSGLFAGHTPPPLPLAAAARQSIRLLQTKKDFRRRLQINTAWLKKRLQELGVLAQTPPTPGPIVCVEVDSRKARNRLHHAFLKAGIFPPITRYPGLPAQGHLRIVVSSEHTRDDLERVAQVCAKLPVQ